MKTNYPSALVVNGIKRVFIGLVLAAGAMLTQPVMAVSPEPVDLGSCSNFAILAGSGIIVAGAVNSTTITGDIGTFPTPSITGIGNVVLNGTNHADDAVTQNAKNDLVTAYNDATGRTYNTTYAGGFNLAGLTLTSGVYNGSSSLALSGTLTLDAQGNPDAVWIFQAGSTLDTASGSSVVLTNGAQACNVFWQVGSSATLGTDSHFEGNILALESITLTTGAMVAGRVLARNAAVSLDTDSISLPKSSQTITNFVPTNGSVFEVTNVIGLSAQASSGLSVSFAVINGPGVITDGTNLTFTNLGPVSVTADQPGDNNWNAAPTVTNTFNVTKAAATVTLNNLNQTCDGGEKTVTATTVPPGLTVDITYDGNSWAPTNVGTYSVTGVVNAAMYEGSTTGTLVVSPLVVILTGTRPYDGTAMAAFGILTVTNKVGSDVVTVDSGSGTLVSSNVGVQAFANFDTLVLGGTASNNYTLTGASGSVTVEAVALTITANADSKAYGGTKTYGAGQTTFTSIGLLNGETIGTVTITASGGTASNAPVGAYDLAPSAAVGGTFIAGNYTITYNNGVLTVGTAALAITANADSKTYGGTKTYGAGQTAFTSTGLLNGETIGTVTITASGGTASNAPVGAYDLAPSAAAGGTFTTSNYTITYNNGVLTVGVAALTITANADSKTYGGTKTYGAGQTTFTNTGLLNGETIGTVTITASGGTASNAPVGAYDLAPSAAAGGTFTPGNYSIVYSNGALTVNKADQAITNFTPTSGSVFAVTKTTGLNATGGSSTNPVMFTVISGPGVISGLTNLTFTNAGTVRVAASQSGDTNWNAAPDVTNTYSVLSAAMLGQTIINFMPINSSEFAEAKVGLSAQATSLLPVSFTVKSGPGVITGGTNLAFASMGLVSIVASQAGNTFYDAAPNMTNVFTITQPLSADIAVSDLVFLPVNVTNLTTAGTVSFQLGNLGPDTLNSAEVAFDFRIGSNDTAMVLLGSTQRAFSLTADQEQLVILTAQEKLDLVVPATLSGIKQVQVTVRHASTLSDPNLANNTTTAVGTVLVRATGVNSPTRSLNDYDGDGKSDGALWHAGNNLWVLCLSGQRFQSISEINTGNLGDVPVPGDYDGDGVTDLAIYCQLNGWWNVQFSSNEQIQKEYFVGGPDFTAAQCDYDGDAITDPAVYRDDGTWYAAASSEEYALMDASLGGTGYEQVVGDYDGDGLADPAVYNRTTGLWQISLSGSSFQIVTGTFGGTGYLPASADYDGDGLVDPAIYAPSTAEWQVLLSGLLAAQGGYTLWGHKAGSIWGIPVPADYDGDGKADLAVYHQDTGIWELFLSTQNYQEFSGDFGGPGYQPVVE